MEKPTIVQVILEKSDAKKLKQEALDNETSVSQIIRELVETYLKGQS